MQDLVVGAGVLDGPGDRCDVGCSPTRVERPVVADQRGQAAPLDQSHGEINQAVGVADIVDRHDVVVLELGEGLGLVPESGLGLAVARLG